MSFSDRKHDDPDRCQIGGCVGYADWLVLKDADGPFSYSRHVCRKCRDEMIACYGWELTNKAATAGLA